MADLRILYVEDNHDLRETVCELLAGHGREILALADAEAAFVAWQAASFDLVIADISLPGMSGTELARRAGLGRVPALAVRRWPAAMWFTTDPDGSMRALRGAFGTG